MQKVCLSIPIVTVLRSIALCPLGSGRDPSALFKHFSCLIPYRTEPPCAGNLHVEKAMCVYIWIHTSTLVYQTSVL